MAPLACSEITSLAVEDMLDSMRPVTDHAVSRVSWGVGLVVEAVVVTVHTQDLIYLSESLCEWASIKG